VSAAGFGADRFGWTDDALAELRRLRGWTEPAIERLELTYDPSSGAVGIPIRDEILDELGRLTYNPLPSRRANGRPKMQGPPGVPRQLFPPPETLAENVVDVLLVEGEPDVVAAWSAGFVAVGVPGTAGWQAGYAARFRGPRWRVHVAFDCDESGRRAAGEVAASLLELGVDVRVVDLDPARADGYDLTDYLLERGAGALRELIAGDELYSTEPPPPWRSVLWPQFRDEAPEAHKWLVEGLLPAGVLGFVAGPPKKGKTWLGIAVALALATGRPLLGYATAPVDVLYVALEGSRTGLRARIGALARGLGANPDSDELDRLHMLYRPRPFDLAELATAAWLAGEAERVDAGLVIVDVLRAAARFRENDAEDFARVRDSFEPLLVADRTALLLHHFGKLTETQKERSPGERMAGTGAMYGALDVGFLITTSTDGARRMRVDIEARDFAAPEALGVAILGTGSGEHGGFTYADTASLELDETAAGRRDLIAELDLLFADGVWRTGDQLVDDLDDVGRKAIEEAIATDAQARAELGVDPRIIRWDIERDGRPPAPFRANARPYGTAAMLELTRSETRSVENEQTRLSDLEPDANPFPPYGGIGKRVSDRVPFPPPPERDNGERETDDPLGEEGP
jgi:hypothetical protein